VTNSGEELQWNIVHQRATKREYGLDRHWRNARTISSHNPRIYRDRDVGIFGVTGDYPQSLFAAKASAEVR
jgi:hypothetical protein